MIINADGGNIGGNIASNGRVVTGNINKNCRIYEDASFNEGIRAVGDISVKGQCINGNDIAIVSETGSIDISADNISLLGFIYAPYGSVTIAGDNVNLNGVCIIADIINIKAKTVNITGNRHIMDWVEENACYDGEEVYIYAFGDYKKMLLK